MTTLAFVPTTSHDRKSFCLVQRCVLTLTVEILTEPMLANWLTVDKDVAFELLQVRDGICIGKPVYRSPGTIVEGTSTAIRSEARHIFEEMRGGGRREKES